MAGPALRRCEFLFSELVILISSFREARNTTRAALKDAGLTFLYMFSGLAP